MFIIDKRIAIIIPTYNRIKSLQNLLFQLQQQINLAHSDVIVVVDGSNDDTIKVLKEKYSFVHTVMGDGSWWYTKSINEGLKYAQKFNPDYCLILNDDLILSENYIVALLNSYSQIPYASIVTSLTLTNDTQKKIMFSGVKKIKTWSLQQRKYHPFLTVYDGIKLIGLHPTQIFPGRGTIIPNSIILDLNYLDEYFIQYHSDGDFCLRALKKGYKVYVNWEAIIYTNLKDTNSATSYLNNSVTAIIKSFFNPYSRNYIPQKIKFIYKHGYKLLLPVTLLIFIFTILSKAVLKKFSNGS